MPSIRFKKRAKKDDRRPCRLCGVKLSYRARYEHAKHSCVKPKPTWKRSNSSTNTVTYLSQYDGEASGDSLLDSDGTDQRVEPSLSGKESLTV